MDGHKQLLPEEISEDRKIASVCIHVEKVIGRMKLFSILKHVYTIPIIIAGLLNQIVGVCACLTNFKPVLVPPHESSMNHTVTLTIT